MLADGCRPPRDQSASPAGTHRNRHQASNSLPSTRCRSPETSRASVQRSSVPRSRRSVPARLRSFWPQPVATPDARVANAVYRPWGVIVNADCASRIAQVRGQGAPTGRFVCVRMKRPADAEGGVGDVAREGPAVGHCSHELVNDWYPSPCRPMAHRFGRIHSNAGCVL
jgi:hypothetical protein